MIVFTMEKVPPLFTIVLARAIGAKQVSSREVTDAYLRWNETINSKLNVIWARNCLLNAALSNAG